MNFEGKVRTTASDVIGNIISIFLVYENLKPNNSKVLKADFCVYVLFFFYPEFSLSLEELYTCKVLKLCYEWNIRKYCKYSHHMFFGRRRKTKWENIKYLWLKVVYNEERFFYEDKKRRNKN